MLTGKDVFDNRSIRAHIVTFGSLFNNLWINRRSQDGQLLKQIHVPISFSDKKSWYRKRQEDSLEGDTPISTLSFPRMAFNLSSMSYDASRQLPTTTKLSMRNESQTSAYRTMNRVPWNYEFELIIAAESLTDNLQMIEQIVPYFSPTYTVQINDLIDLGITTDLPITLKSGPSRDYDYEDRFQKLKIRSYTMTFEMKGYIYLPVKSQGLILKSFVNLINQTNDFTVSQGVAQALGNDPEDGCEVRINYPPDIETTTP